MNPVIFTAKNPFLQRKYFIPISQYTNTSIISFSHDIKNSTILIEAEQLNEGIILKLKNNGNKIVSFDINDNTSLTHTCLNTEHILDVDLIFKFSGIQKTPESNEISISSDLQYGIRSIPFLDDFNRAMYFKLKEFKKIYSLPYVLWDNPTYFLPVSYQNKVKKILVRGGEHIERAQLLFNLLKHGQIDKFSQFSTHTIVSSHMCGYCKNYFKEKGKFLLEMLNDDSRPCKLPDDIFNDDFLTHVDEWNNSCVTRFFEFGLKFNELNSPLDLNLMVNVFNGKMLEPKVFLLILRKYLLYADFKHIFSIYIPPRFWEAASLGTINFYHRRTNDQDYFPEISDGIHYLTYSEDFSDVGNISITNQEHDFIVSNSLGVYNKWIKQNSSYGLNTNLIDYIWGIINEV